MRDLFFKFLQTPNRDTFLAIRQAVLVSGRYEPYSDELAKIDELFDQGKFADAKLCFRESMANLLLSPRAHLMLSMIEKQMGNEEESKMEGFFASSCAEGILTTGDGTKEKPYLVLRTSDEHDLVQYLGKQFEQQALVQGETKHYDMIRCADGTELWFDITDPFNKLSELTGSQK